MKKMMSGIIASLALLLFPTSLVSASENEEPASLENIEQILVKNPESLEEFRNLSDDDQEVFVDSLNDPELFNENLKIEMQESVTEKPALVKLTNSFATFATTYTTTLTTRYNMTILGVNITTYRHVLVYNRTGGKATKVLSNTAVVERSINPMVSTGLSSKSSYISNGKAYGTADFYYRIGPFKGLSVQIGNLHHKLVGNGSGSITTSSWIKQ